MNDSIHFLEVKKLSVGYGGVPILGNINLYLNPGEIVGIIGKNGSGKSTILRTISGLQDKIEGDIFIKGKSLLHKSALARVEEFKIGCLLQHNRNIPNLSVRENLHLAQWKDPSWSDRERQIEKILSQEPFIQLIPSLDASANVLSGGQDLILAIAALILQESDLIILDEPSDGLDEGNKASVIKVIRDLKNQRIAIIVVEQLLRVLFALVDRVYVIKNEKVYDDNLSKKGFCTFAELNENDTKLIKNIYQTNDVLMTEHSEMIDSLLWDADN